MRTLFALLTALALLLSGCASSSDGGGGDATPTPTGGDEPAPLPADESHSELVVIGLDPQNYADGSVCTLPSEGCIHYPISLERDAQVHAELTWLLPANDFDLLLRSDSEDIAYIADSPPETVEEFTVELAAGDYEVIVIPWLVVAETFQLDITFSEP